MKQTQPTETFLPHIARILQNCLFPVYPKTMEVERNDKRSISGL